MLYFTIRAQRIETEKANKKYEEEKLLRLEGIEIDKQRINEQRYISLLTSIDRDMDSSKELLASFWRENTKTGSDIYGARIKVEQEKQGRIIQFLKTCIQRMGTGSGLEWLTEYYLTKYEPALKGKQL